MCCYSGFSARHPLLPSVPGLRRRYGSRAYALARRRFPKHPADAASAPSAGAGRDAERIVSAYRWCRSQAIDDPPVPEKRDGRAANRIVEVMVAQADGG